MTDALRRSRRRFIQVLLRSSLAVSVVLMGAGLSVWIAQGESDSPGTTPAQLFGTADLGHRLMLAGILVLAVTPALRLAALLGLWVRERMWSFAANAGLVLVLLAAAYWFGRN